MLGSIPHHYTYMYMKKVVYNFGFAWQTLTPKSSALDWMLYAPKWRNELPCNAYLFGDAYSHLVGELLYVSQEEKVIKKQMKG